MDNYSFTNCASRFVFIMDKSEDYILITSDLEILLQSIPYEIVPNDLFVGRRLLIKEMKYLIKYITIKYYPKKLDSDEFPDHIGNTNDFCVEIWVWLDLDDNS